MRKRRFSYTNIFESFSDVSLLMLATFLFLMVTILITSRFAQEYQVPKLKEQVEDLKNQLAASQMAQQRYAHDLEQMAVATDGGAMQRVIDSATFGRKDFDLFVEGLRELPGKDLHLMIDASGSMHGLSTFIIPLLRAMVIRSGKRLTAVTWFTDDKADTYTGSMGQMFDQLITGAPFAGNRETVGRAFRHAIKSAPAPGAYLLIGDEPSDDRIYFTEIPAPVFTLPLGRDDPDTTHNYRLIADSTRGKMLHLDFR